MKNKIFGFKTIESDSADGGIFIDPQILKNDKELAKEIQKTMDLNRKAVAEAIGVPEKYLTGD